MALLLIGCTGSIGGDGNGSDGGGGTNPTSPGGGPLLLGGGGQGLSDEGGRFGSGGMAGASAFGGAAAEPPTGGSGNGGEASTSSGSEPTTGSGIDPPGDWQVGQLCAVEVFEDGATCDHGMGFGTFDPDFVNPCPENCVRNNHVCTWTCRPTCTPNPDPCGPDPCAADGHGQCAAGICWPFTHCDCVNQGLCADCAEAPCP